MISTTTTVTFANISIITKGFTSEEYDFLSNLVASVTDEAGELEPEHGIFACNIRMKQFIISLPGTFPVFLQFVNDAIIINSVAYNYDSAYEIFGLNE